MFNYYKQEISPMITKIDSEDSITIDHNQLSTLHPPHPKPKPLQFERDSNLYRSVGHTNSTTNSLLLNKIRDNAEKLCFKQSLPRMKIGKQEKGVSKHSKKNKSRSTLLQELEQKIYGIKQAAFGESQKHFQHSGTLSGIFQQNKTNQFQNCQTEMSPDKKLTAKLQKYSSQKQFKELSYEFKNEEGQMQKWDTKNNFIDQVSEPKNRTSAPIRNKSETSAFWDQVFSNIKLNGKQDRSSIENNQEVEVRGSSKEESKKVSELNHTVNYLGSPAKSESKKVGSRSECEKFYYPEKYQREMGHKNSFDSFTNGHKKSKQEFQLKKTCQKSSQILKNTKLLLQNIRNSPYYPPSPYSPQREALQTVEEISNKKESAKISKFNPTKKQSNLESIRSYTDLQNAASKQIQVKQNKLINESSSSTNFTIPFQTQLPNLSLSHASQPTNFSSSKVSNPQYSSVYSPFTSNVSNTTPSKNGQIRKRICSPVNGRPCKKTTLSEFKQISVASSQMEDSSSEEAIGRGKFGEVFLCMHIETKMLFALKQISKEKIKKYRMIQQAVDQIKIHSTLFHPNITKMFGFFEEKDNVYLILQYIEGGTLFDYLNEVGSIPLRTTLKFLQDVIKAVTYMHEKSIAHRDIKPQNILLANKYFNGIEETYGAAKLCDFGWSAFMETSRRTYCGTFDYVPPQVLQRKKYDISVDVWSIGVLAFQMLTGKVPYEGDRSTVIFNKINEVEIDYPEVSAEFPIQAKNFIQALVRKNPQERPKCKQLLKMPLFVKYSSEVKDELETIFQNPKRIQKRKRIAYH